jgi:quercetin dioxygenase-like cupin family protein
MQVLKARKRSTDRGPSNWFTGVVWLDELAIMPLPSHLRVHLVTFEPGARTAWHSHPVGQVLYATHGVGRAQQRGNAPVEIHAGETVYVAPDEQHWHGAAPGHLFSHIAIQEASTNGAETTWLEHVNEKEYAANASVE